MSDDPNSTVDICEEIEARKQQEIEKYPPKDPPGSGGGDEITPQLTLTCLNNNEEGDGYLFAIKYKNKLCYIVPFNQWNIFNGSAWSIDELGEVFSKVEGIKKCYLELRAYLVKQLADADENERNRIQKILREIEKRVRRLSSVRGRDNCLKFASVFLAIKADQFDKNPWLIPAENAVIDLKTGNDRPGRPDDRLSKQCLTKWQGLFAPCPIWELTLQTIFPQPIIEYLQRVWGYGLTGLAIEHIFLVFWGAGRNGKSLILEILLYVLGALAGPIQTELLLDQGRVRNSAAPSPDVMSLRGLRLAFASEVDEGRRISPSRVKWLTGGDTLIARHPHDKFEVRFKPTHLLILSTNHRPAIPPDDFALWERLHLVPFNLSFVDREPVLENERRADKILADKLKAEAPGILGWLVRGCLAWQQQGLDPPPIVKQATAAYRRDEDLLADFIDQCCVLDPKLEVSAAALYKAFEKWFEENIGKNAPKQQKFGRMMTKRFKREKRQTYVYFGLALLD